MQRIFAFNHTSGQRPRPKVCWINKCNTFVRLKPSLTVMSLFYDWDGLSWPSKSWADCNACIWADNFSNFPNSQQSRAPANEKSRAEPANEDARAKQSLSQLRQELSTSHLSADRQNNLNINLRGRPRPTTGSFPVNNFQRRVDV